jgi:TorA maturation chaperone TorD
MADRIRHGSGIPAGAGAQASGVDARPAELLRALAVLAEQPHAGHTAVAEAIGLGAPAAGADYARLFLLELRPYASVHLDAGGMLGGEVRDRVGGFWRAVGRTPPREADHLSSLLVLYASLLDEGAGPPSQGPDGAGRALAAGGAAALLHEHLEPWVFTLLDRVRDLGTLFQVRWAALTEDVLLGEAAWAGRPASLPAHLESAPPLPDPRQEGAQAFLSGLLAPVRCGIVLTRTDLARVASDLGLGAGLAERRRSLEALLGDHASEALTALADAALESARRHNARVPILGPTAAFWSARAQRTADLLGELAGGADTVLVERLGEAR